MVGHRTTRAFTLVEILIAIAIVGILATIVAVGFDKYFAEARDKAREADVSILMSAFEAYYTKNGEYPYTNDLNPTAAMGKLPNYDAVFDILPQLPKDALGDDTGYNFWTIGCSGCSSTSEELKERATQYIYFSGFEGSTSNTLQYPYSAAYPYLWGCKVNTNDSTPAFMIAWRSEVTGLWTFKKSKRGQMTIENYGTTRPPGQACSWS